MTWVLWTLVAILSAAAWMVWALEGSNTVAVLLGLTSAAVVGPATIAHGRLYVVRLAFIVRSSAACAPPGSSPLHSVEG